MRAGGLDNNRAVVNTGISPISLIRHRHGAFRLRHKTGGLTQLQTLLDQHSFWASGRTLQELYRMLVGSQAVVSAWHHSRLVGFGRATSDRVFRAALWDVVVAGEYRSQGLGRRLVEALLEAPELVKVERVYLMTTNGAAFYEQLGFKAADSQRLMLRTIHC
jgi:ribosomal protein S18 acetylase RimI-like enzyme